MKFKNLTSIFTILVGFLLTLGASAQEPPQKLFGEKIEVRVVNVEVVVEDRQGNRVLGLSDEDFRLRVDGDEMPLSFFNEVVFGQLAETPETETAAAVASVVPTLSKVAPGEPVGTSYLVFIDEYFTTVERDRNRILQQMIDDLPLLGLKDQMAVVAFDGRQVQMLTPWTDSQRQLRRTLQDAMERPVFGIRTFAALRDADVLGLLDKTEVSVTDPEPASDSAGPTSLERRDSYNRFRSARSSVDYIENQLDRIVVGVTSSMRAFAKPEGRKVMMLLSGGWPNSAFDYVHGSIPLIDRPGESDARGSKIYEPIFELANLLSYTLYTVDVPGQGRLSAHADESDEVAMARTGPAFDDSTGPNAGFAGPVLREDELHTTLLRLADKTGGKAMLDRAGIESLQQVVGDTRSYYWLGFTPEWRGDDRNHRIKLEVLQPGLKIRYRTSYQDLSRKKEIDFMIESALMFGDMPGGHHLRVELGPLPKDRGKRIALPLELQIPMDAITMIHHGGEYVAELELQIGSLDESGNRNEISVIPVRLSGTEPPPPGAHATYEITIKIRRKEQDLVFALHDPLNDNVLTAVTKFEP